MSKIYKVIGTQMGSDISEASISLQ